MRVEYGGMNAVMIGSIEWPSPPYKQYTANRLVAMPASKRFGEIVAESSCPYSSLSRIQPNKYAAAIPRIANHRNKNNSRESTPHAHTRSTFEMNLSAA